MVFTLLICGFLYFCLYHFYLKRRNLPPGPFPLPFLGTIHYFLGQSTGEELQLKWRRQYGKLYTVWQGRRPVILVADNQLIHEMFVKDADNYVDRGVEQDFMEELHGGKGGIFFSDGDVWRENRRFALHVLRNMGLGKSLMEERILEEIQTLSSRIDDASQKSMDFEINPLIDMSVGSIINCLMFGYRYTDDKLPEFHDLSERARCFMQASGHPLSIIVQSSGYVNIFKRLPFLSTKFSQAIKSGHYLIDFFRQRVEDYKKQMDLDSEPIDYTNAFLQEMKRRESMGETEYFNDRQLTLMLFDLWVAGQETTANTFEWNLAHLLHNPQIQAKAHEELDRNIGSNRLITMADKPNLPYISALLNETLRISNIVPLSIPRRVTRDTTVNGYLLKKDTWVIPQISVIMFDPEVYKSPYKFDPERFLDSNGKLISTDKLLAFSVGKRACLGEGLARMELFLFIANLLNQYKFLPSKQLPDLTRYIGITVRPKGFKCRVEKRH